MSFFRPTGYGSCWGSSLYGSCLAEAIGAWAVGWVAVAIAPPLTMILILAMTPGGKKSQKGQNPAASMVDAADLDFP
mgnify:CR=1 FL=1